MQHRRTTAASIFQNGISQNTKCDIMVGFPKSSHIFVLHLCTDLYVHRFICAQIFTCTRKHTHMDIITAQIKHKISHIIIVIAHEKICYHSANQQYVTI